MIMRKVAFVILIFFTAQTFGQKITFDASIQFSQDSNIIAIRELWKSYVLNYKNENDEIGLKYWNKSEVDQGYTDIVVSATPNRSYLNANLLTFEISKINNQYYRLRNILTLEDTNGETPFNYFTIIFNVLAKKDTSVYKFYNCLYLNKPNLLHFETENIDFLYPTGYKFNKGKALELCASYSNLIKTFGNPNKSRVTYLIGDNLDDAYRNIGVEYTTFSSSNLSAGYHIEKQNIILTCREDHLHELVHTILKKYGGSGMFQEGIATYYGGMGGVNYSELIFKLQQVISKRPNIDLSRFDDLDNSINNGDFNNYYVIGAIFIDYAFKIGGSKKVIALFRYEDMDSFQFDGAIKAISTELGISSDQIDSFIKNYIKNYKTD
jgi:hypothetical protein